MTRRGVLVGAWRWSCIRGCFRVRVYATNQYYDNVVGRHTVSMQFYNEISLVSVPTKVQQPCTASAYFVKLLIILAEMCRKKMEAIKESDRTRTMNGSLRLQVG